ncbi:hypothetical protein B296_00027062 [Ensete ventricosum]|uniref:Uncharacterized protein n=1 Tax=Ensete ventricosum TaxID=4639 RepID=A0A426YMD2_ENSVE|nr:hypothetical protein B296_00027062 [Ensete ventricosum]
MTNYFGQEPSVTIFLPQPQSQSHPHPHLPPLTPTSPTASLAAAVTSSSARFSLVTVAPSSSPPLSVAPFFLPCRSSGPPLPSLLLLPIIGPSLLLSSARQPPATAIPTAAANRRPIAPLHRSSAARPCHPCCRYQSTVVPSVAATQPSSSIAAGPLPLKHQQRCHYLVAPHLLVTPHDAVASSLAAAALTAAALTAAVVSNRAPCRCTSLLPSLHLLATIAAPPYCDRYRSLLLTQLSQQPLSLPATVSSSTTIAPPSPTSFSTYWWFLRRQSRWAQVLSHRTHASDSTTEKRTEYH